MAKMEERLSEDFGEKMKVDADDGEGISIAIDDFLFRFLF